MKDTKHIRKKATRKEGRKEGSNRRERVGKNERKEGHETRRNKECDFLFLFHVFPLHVRIIMVVLLCAQRLLPVPPSKIPHSQSKLAQV